MDTWCPVCSRFVSNHRVYPRKARLRLGVCTRSGRILRAQRRMLRTRDDTLVRVAT
ncbi:hypothetical protein FA95DRAFT_1375191 [Auriscalpium vulgare]|uniref:Uncharacterized protein n=1 Tax=Auriscalpium vulgare TaxID=40419 RepID=A0ACB8RRR5_9AGAM|nr:hypothetical protein FA95DRAFT_1375191 [Auriscalpium vulgare]